MNLHKSSPARARVVALSILLGIAGLIVVLVTAFYALNNYIYQEKQGDGSVIEPYRATLEGEYVCLPHKNTTGPQTQECAFGLKLDTGEYYAIDFGLMSQEQKPVSVGDRISASGLVTPIERLSTDHWQIYPIEGIFSVTDIDSSTSEAAFYPPGGMGDVVQYETLEHPFRLPVRYHALDEVTVQVFKVDKENFYKNTNGGFAAFEGHLNLLNFRETVVIYNDKATIYPDPEGKVINGLSEGYLELPIMEEGYYYLAFTHSDSENNKYHLLLHIGPKDAFNYSI